MCSEIQKAQQPETVTFCAMHDVVCVQFSWTQYFSVLLVGMHSHEISTTWEQKWVGSCAVVCIISTTWEQDCLHAIISMTWEQKFQLRTHFCSHAIRRSDSEPRTHFCFHVIRSLDSFLFSCHRYNDVPVIVVEWTPNTTSMANCYCCVNMCE